MMTLPGPPCAAARTTLTGLVGGLVCAALLSACGGGGGSEETGAFSSEPLTASFLTQATFGPSRSEIERLSGASASQWYQDQLTLTPSFMEPAFNAHMSLLTTDEYSGFRVASPSLIFWCNAVGAPDQLRQRMAFALSQILVVSAANGDLRGRPEGMIYYQDLLIEHALGNYRDLLEAVTYSPAMGYYLTYIGSKKADPERGRMPDENYARELLQLFTIGVVDTDPQGRVLTNGAGQPRELYDNDDITGLARVFAGYDVFRDQRQGVVPDATRARSVLQALEPRNGERFGDRRFALPPEMTRMKKLFVSGRAGIVANVGPLIQPTTRADFDDRRNLPPRLFSHNDQQSVWQANAPEGARFGWGGLFADAALRSGANPDAQDFTTVSTTGDALFLTGERTRPFNIGGRGPAQVKVLGEADRRRRWNDDYEAIYQRYRRHFSARDFRGDNRLARDVASIMGRSLASNEAYQAATKTEPALGTQFPDSRLGRQLEIIAETIAVRSRLGVGRQVFFAGTGGFDTHSGQAGRMPQLLADIDASVGAFQSAMEHVGEARDVTLFTSSDFGRTFAANGDGTDHGWGGHHFLVGGAVAGGEIYGDPPPPGFDHAWGAGGGRLIPSVSVDQYAAELDAALPNLRNFETGPAFTA